MAQEKSPDRNAEETMVTQPVSNFVWREIDKFVSTDSPETAVVGLPPSVAATMFAWDLAMCLMHIRECCRPSAGLQERAGHQQEDRDNADPGAKCLEHAGVAAEGEAEKYPEAEPTGQRAEQHGPLHDFPLLWSQSYRQPRRILVGHVGHDRGAAADEEQSHQPG